MTNHASLRKYVLGSLLGLLVSGVDAANFYVDSAVPVSGNGQSWATAFKTFSAITWASINPGDTVYISGGSTTKTYNSTLVVGKSGTSASRITIRVGQEAGHSGVVIFDGARIRVSSNYVTLDGGVGGNKNILLKNILSYADKDIGAAIDGGGTQGLVIENVRLDNVNNGIQLHYATAYTVRNNIFTGVRGDYAVRGIMTSGAFDTNKIHDNDFEALTNGGGPDTIQVGGGTSIFNNRFKAVVTSNPGSTQHPDTLQLAGRNIKIYNNVFENIADSNIDYDAWPDGVISNIYIFNNLFRLTKDIDPYPDFMRFYSTGAAINSFSNLKILNNTFVDERPSRAGTGQLVGFGFAYGTGAGSGNEFKNNLFRGTPSGMGINMDRGGANFSMSYSNNVYPYATRADPGGRIGVPSLDANFVPTSSDTLARDGGTSLSYFSTDRVGTARPQGSTWDIGSYEYSGTVTTISPPRNLQVR